ncbi:hypothetical protein UPYG_G00236880 [Umbra pygmaea]|uniref:Ig-like domain-containing protein n=1 Tax=Umbra pygmaea TaxID=75934 RepID=A0ABD0WEJ2_UMBPY
MVLTSASGTPVASCVNGVGHLGFSAAAGWLLMVSGASIPSCGVGGEAHLLAAGCSYLSEGWAGNVVLESPVHPVTEGDSVTLNCTYRNQTSLISKVEFYKDGVLIIRNETRGKMTIPTVSKSHEGFYKCKYNEEESPGSWVTLKDHGSFTSVLIGVVVGLAVAAVLLVIILVLLCKCKKGKDTDDVSAAGPGDVTYAQIQPTAMDKKKRKKRANQIEDHVYSEVKKEKSTATAGVSTATGSDDVTYAQIQLKKPDKKKKKKQASPKESSVYSELKPGNATAASGPVDVTYAEIELKEKAKAKKKNKSTRPPEAGPVYAQVKPGRAHGP